MKAKPAAPADRPLLERVRDSGRTAELIAEVRSRGKVRDTRKKILRHTAVVTAAFLGILVWAVPFFRETETIATAAARRQTLVLRDGSQAELNANTDLRTDFRYGRRVLELSRGEAFFSVVSDPNHPFLVATPAGTVRVTGTHFNVRLTGGQAEVTLLEGKVDFESKGDGPKHLVPGQQLDTRVTAIRNLSPAELNRVADWRQGRIALGGLTLAEALTRLAAYHGRAITWAPAIAELHPGGTVALDDLPGFLEALESTLPVRVNSRPDGAIYIEPR